MSITLGGILLLMATCFEVACAKNTKEQFAGVLLITILVELFIGRGYFIKIGEHETAFRAICEYASFIMAVYCAVSLNTRFDRRLLARVFAFVAILIAGWLLLIAIPTGATGANFLITWDDILLKKASRVPVVFDTSMVGYMLRMLMFSFVAMVMHAAFNENDWSRLVGRTVKCLQILVLLCVIEVIAKYGFGSNVFHDVADSILGQSESTYLYVNQRGDGFLLNGLTKEGSHYTFALAIIALLFLYDRRSNSASCKKKSERVLFVSATAACAIELALSMSFSVLWYGVCIALALVVLWLRRAPMLQVVTMIVFGFVLAAGVFAVLPTLGNLFDGSSYFGRRLNMLYSELQSIAGGTWLGLGSSGDWSTRVRLGSAYETLALLQYRPLLGLGFGSVTAHSSFAVMLTGCGVGGMVLYMVAFYGSLAPENNKLTYYCLIFCFLLMTLFVSINCRPFFEVWSLVLLYVFKSISGDGNARALRRSACLITLKTGSLA